MDSEEYYLFLDEFMAAIKLRYISFLPTKLHVIKYIGILYSKDFSTKRKVDQLASDLLL